MMGTSEEQVMSVTAIKIGPMTVTVNI